MAKKEFEDLKGKLEPSYPKPKVPKELDKVGRPKKPKVGTFKFAEYMRFAWMILLGQGEKLLHPERVAGEKFMSWTTVGLISLGVILIIIMSLFR